MPTDTYRRKEWKTDRAAEGQREAADREWEQEQEGERARERERRTDRHRQTGRQTELRKDKDKPTEDGGTD
ncbi:hypothetical protein CBR_g38041 [Chara braunii]|uniref:Uncharacterized protein n=1 Tax=Chara braunii TaxID=69332 RepID=A0A388K040_CHABU|nr:hypothetical protein CBR_g38041 [Chara braunii]|eukprot:GBG63419.1 hypothetical protein CBR_g38041 [Chara braunii]